MTERKKKSSSKVLSVALIAVMLAGFSLLLYPTVANWWNRRHQTTVTREYDEIVNKLTNEEYEKILDAAAQYNLEWSQKSERNAYLTDEEHALYKKIFAMTDSDAMGYIQIPSINIQLAIYPGTAESVLRVGVGHLDWTALPVGGPGTHCVLSGHRGLPSARLFTDLPNLVMGDTFTLHILDKIYTYEVDQILIVLPQETDALLPEDGRDFCTLLTCTPYGVNSHRLLVRGHRIENANASTGRVQANAARVSQLLVAVLLGAPILMLLFLGALVFIRPKKEKRYRLQNERK